MEAATTTSPVPALDAERIAAEFPILSRQIDGKPITYLDSAATAQKPRAVLDALYSVLAEHNANIHRGVYPLAQEATELFEGARHTVRGGGRPGRGARLARRDRHGRGRGARERRGRLRARATRRGFGPHGLRP